MLSVTGCSCPDERQAITDMTDLRCALATFTLAINVVPGAELDMVQFLFNQVRCWLQVGFRTRRFLRMSITTFSVHSPQTGPCDIPIVPHLRSTGAFCGVAAERHPGASLLTLSVFR